MNRSSNKPVIQGLVSLLLVLAAAGFAEAIAQPLSLQDAVRLGLERNYALQALRRQSEITAGNVTWGNAGALPRLDLYATWDAAVLDANVEVATGAEMDTSGASTKLITAGAQVQWTLFDGTRMFIEYEKLKTLHNSSKLGLQQAIESSVVQITLAYCGLVRETQLVKVCRKSLDISDFRLFLAHERKKKGLGSELEVIQATVNRQADSTSLLQAVYRLRKSVVELNRLLVNDLQQEVTPSDSISLLPPEGLDALAKSALANNTALKQEEELSRLDALNIRAIRAERYPHLLLRGGYGYSENETHASFIRYNRTLGPTIGLSAGMKIFDGMNLNRRLREARLNKDVQDLLVRDAEQQVMAAVTSSYVDYQGRVAVIDLCRKAEDLAKTNMRIAQEAFKEGLVSSLQFREAQDALSRASADLVNALYDAKYSETELLRLSGSLVK